MTVPRPARLPNQRLKRLRAERGMTQEDLVKRLRAAGWGTCGVRTIQRYESGEITTPSWVARLALERVFGMSTEELGFPEITGEIAAATIQRPMKFYIFDRADDGTESLNVRTAACWDWCNNIRVRCLDEFIAWEPEAREPFPLLLVDAIQACRDASAGLLVYTIDKLGGPAIVRRVLAQLGNIQLWTVEPLARRVTLDMLPSTEDAESEKTRPVTAGDEEEQRMT